MPIDRAAIVPGRQRCYHSLKLGNSFDWLTDERDMAKSATLRVEDARAIHRLIGECRDLGTDPQAWRRHWVDGLGALVDAVGGISGEMAGCRSLALVDLGAIVRWQPGVPEPRLDAETGAFLLDPANWPSQLAYHRRSRAQGSCLTRPDFIEDRDWWSMRDYRWIRDLLGADHRLFCFRALPRGGPDDHVGTILARPDGCRNFGARDQALVELATEFLAPLLGGPLARFAEPSPVGLAPQVRRVLRCLLEGDGDKQVAARLGLSVHTVNQYTKVIYRHFRTPGRAELLAHWLRRGWSVDGPWSG